MDELVPVILGAILGAAIWRPTTGWARLALGVLAVLVAGAFATVTSGEYQARWIYLLLDVGEAALGLAAGFFISCRFLPAREGGLQQAALVSGSSGEKR